MAKGNINPDFQAAPFLGESSHNPIEFQRRHKMIKYQNEKLRQEQIEENTAKGLQRLMLDLKGWEDQEGFKEIVNDHDKVINGFLDLSKKGLNLTSPKTSQEILAFKAITDAQQKIMQKVDTWGQNKKTYDLVEEAIKQDASKPADDQRIDWDTTRKNVSNAMKGISINDRQMQVEKLLAVKPQIGDVHKYVADNMEFITKPDIVQVPYTDPSTGLQGSRSNELMTPENEKKREQDLRKLYQTAPEPVLNAIKIAKAKDKTLDVMKDEDYFVSMYDPKFKQKMVDKISGTGGGFEINLGGGGKITMQPGSLRPEATPYGDKTYTNSYIWPTPTKSITIPIGATGSAQFLGTTWSPIEKGGTVEATPYLYDPATEEFVFNVTSNQNAPWVQNNRPVSIPRSVIGALADDFPIIVNGKKSTLKEVYGTTKQTKNIVPGTEKNFWSTPPYIPKKK